MRWPSNESQKTVWNRLSKAVKELGEDATEDIIQAAGKSAIKKAMGEMETILLAGKSFWDDTIF